MAKLRKGVAYRNLERPYTRTSKFKGKSYIKMSPNIAVTKFDTGNAKKRFQYTLKLLSKNNLQIRDKALESARQTSNRLLEKTLGLGGYYAKLRPYPYHILRENPIAAGAGADRFSTGMQKSFGNPIGVAAQIKQGEVIMEVSVEKPNISLAKEALARASKKLPCSCTIQIIENK